ncbi:MULTISPECIES: hypothetical protein [unclassified Microcoleus]|uniref:hypothetical protein n=1 Tax=unclassified Microcoleus TaxID=2642155 RepID=UPI002FCF54EF
MMRLIRWLTDLINDDYEKRVLARYILVYVDAFLKLAPVLKNQIKATEVNVNTLREPLKNLREDYNSFYATIRHKLSAHRQDLPLVDRIEAWNEIDDVTVNTFINDASQIYNLLNSLNFIVPSFIESNDIGNSDLKFKLENLAKQEGSSGVKLAMDNLAFSRPNTVQKICTREIEKRGSQVVSILDTIKVLRRLYLTLSLGKDTERLGKAMLIVDTINLIDNLYPKIYTDAKYKVNSFLEISQQQGHRGYQILKDAYEQRDINAEGGLREVRNKIAAHVDDNPSQNLKDLLALLDLTTIEQMLQVFLPAQDAFIKCCQQDVKTSSLLCHDTPLKRVTRLIKTDDSQPYSDN